MWIEGDDIDRQLRPWEMVSGDVVLEIHENAVAIPKGALIYDEHETPFVFVKKADGYKKQQVHTGIALNEWVEIISGITDEDSVVVQGAYELFHQDFSKVYKVAD